MMGRLRRRWLAVVLATAAGFALLVSGWFAIRSEAVTLPSDKDAWRLAALSPNQSSGAGPDTQAVGGQCGDLTLDGAVNIFDVISLLQVIVGLVQPSPVQEIVSYVNEDGNTNIFDAILVQQNIVGSVAIAGCGVLDEVRPDEMSNLVMVGANPSTADPQPGEEVTVEVVVENRSIRDEAMVAVALMEGGQQLTVAHTNIRAGGRATVYLSWTAPLEETLATLAAVVDPDQQRVEIERLDNEISVDLAVTSPPSPDADLSVMDPTPTTTALQPIRTLLGSYTQ